jgi:uncharacterized protein (DUF433 family)
MHFFRTAQERYHHSLTCPHVYIKRASNRFFVINDDLLERITINPRVMVGKPVIRGTRLTVEYILGLLAHGTTMEEILAEYPGLEKDDIHACLLFASKTLQDASFIPLAAEAV